MATTTTTAATLETIRRATEGHDAEALAGLYADEATVTIIDRSRPPSRPEVLRGRAAIADHLRRAAAQEMTHEVRDEVGDGRRLAYAVACRYPDGTRVHCVSVAALDAEGRIERETLVQAWDE